MEVRKETTLIGKGPIPVPQNPDEAVLELFKAPPEISQVSLTTSEFTSLCPYTGQPDWATVEISYIPDEWCIETKSLKLYLQSFRNVKGTIESIANRIYTDLHKALNPTGLLVVITSTPRGGISIKAQAGGL